MKLIVRYRCDSCHEMHDDYVEARECCPPEITEVYFCGHCTADFSGDEDGANECCADIDPDAEPIISHAVLEAHGQMRLSV